MYCSKDFKIKSELVSVHLLSELSYDKTPSAVIIFSLGCATQGHETSNVVAFIGPGMMSKKRVVAKVRSGPGAEKSYLTSVLFGSRNACTITPANCHYHVLLVSSPLIVRANDILSR